MNAHSSAATGNATEVFFAPLLGAEELTAVQYIELQPPRVCTHRTYHERCLCSAFYFYVQHALVLIRWCAVVWLGLGERGCQAVDGRGGGDGLKRNLFSEVKKPTDSNEENKQPDDFTRTQTQQQQAANSSSGIYTIYTSMYIFARVEELRT